MIRRLVSASLALFMSTPLLLHATPGARLLKSVTQNGFLLNEAMVATLASRCERYLYRTPGAGLWRQNRCRNSARVFKRALDQETFAYTESDGERASTQVAFRSRAQELLTDPNVLNYLSSLWQEIELSFATGRDLNLFEYTAHYTGSQEKAFEWLAVLFQDNSPTQSLLRWLETHPAPSWSRNPELTELIHLELVTMTDFLTAWRLGFVEPTFTLELFPRQFAKDSQGVRKPYHFYVPAFLALEMERLGVEGELAQFQSYMFNYLYEIFHSERVLPKILTEPASVTASERVIDIYAGYVGSIMALGPWPERLNFEEFKFGMSLSPYELNLHILKTLYRDKPHRSPALPLGLVGTF